MVLGAGRGVQADRRRGRQVEALRAPPHGNRNDLIDQIDDVGGQPPRLVAHHPGRRTRELGVRNPVEAATAGMSDAEFRKTLPGQPLPWRAAIIAAGPIANFILAALIFFRESRQLRAAPGSAGE